MSERVIGIPGYINASDTSAILTAVEVFWVKCVLLLYFTILMTTFEVIQ